MTFPHPIFFSFFLIEKHSTENELRFAIKNFSKLLLLQPLICKRDKIPLELKVTADNKKILKTVFGSGSVEATATYNVLSASRR